MLNFLRRNNQHQQQSSPDKYQGNSLDKSMTEIAISLINGQSGAEFSAYFINLFKNDPRFIKNVDPEYREALQQLLESAE
ncbi:hypothetical protein NIES2135_48120 [Leptolyngbya boryana NIES-2135]|jgi:hypothetical protein|uniref:Uncharacterized protein n=1 Tax=Leptolyngbya boryana NIES-2135 TaxID=1973484 RepID=A0A1Z4JMG0_LEPBY|nr:MULTISPECIES: hypothetical protein [Leptolyngbya]MBD2367384.1 hypothetical protein [Leptolyngbya sp. FACHB-161]BAY57939.1 hypothetical protein NIES2135_48120 [Leptolyngbya boryana NIES-2135]MBD2373908.1 hypothetical protein [Leptolyngbya sp. FACHB-238]MBD2398292.1 hypothetical protein [Leptolyngbya sp. FACHB-239]MBD2404211.1 hypothetical protein [Leptolyngbya sp. FACHB-402]